MTLTATQARAPSRPDTLAQLDSLSDLPLVAVRAPGDGRTLAVMLSGDGNWAGLDRTVAQVLNQDGISVVGLKSRAYLRSGRRDPDSAARDLARILRVYLDAWQADSVMVIGYSCGAELGPFMVSRLPEELRARVRLVALLSPGRRGSFEFHLSDLLADQARPGDLPVRPEVERLRGIRLLCVYGTEETRGSLCPDLEPSWARVVAKEGGHHLDRDYRALGRLILEEWFGRATRDEGPGTRDQGWKGEALAPGL